MCQNKNNVSWHMDKPYLKIKGKDACFYRVVDKFGNTIDFLVSEIRDKKSALLIFIKAIGENDFAKNHDG